MARFARRNRACGALLLSLLLCCLGSGSASAAAGVNTGAAKDLSQTAYARQGGAFLRRLRANGAAVGSGKVGEALSTRTATDMASSFSNAAAPLPSAQEGEPEELQALMARDSLDASGQVTGVLSPSGSEEGPAAAASWEATPPSSSGGSTPAAAPGPAPEAAYAADPPAAPVAAASLEAAAPAPAQPSYEYWAMPPPPPPASPGSDKAPALAWGMEQASASQASSA